MIETEIVTKSDYIKTLFIEEFKDYNNYLSDDFCEKFGDVIEDMIDRISIIEYENISLELTPDNAIVFDIKLQDEKNLYIKHHFNSKDEVKDTYFSIFHNHKCIETRIGNFEDVMINININNLKTWQHT